MNKDILRKVLKLDSIFHFLTWKDRVRIHLYMLKRDSCVTAAILKLYEWIIENDWEAPDMKYGHDRLLYFEITKDTWEPIENYYCDKINQLIK